MLPAAIFCECFCLNFCSEAFRSRFDPSTRRQDRSASRGGGCAARAARSGSIPAMACAGLRADSVACGPGKGVCCS